MQDNRARESGVIDLLGVVDQKMRLESAASKLKYDIRKLCVHGRS